MAIAPPAAAQPAADRLLLDLSLEARPVRVLGLENGRITYEDRGGLVRSEPFDQHAAIIPAGPAPRPAPSRPFVELTDGQRFPGAPARGAADEHIAWRTDEFAVLDIPLDLLRRVVLDPAVARLSRAGPLPANDTVVLANGDTLEGFVESAAGPVRVERDGGAAEIPLDRVAEIRFASPPTRAAGPFVWLRSGAVAAIAGSTTSRGGDVTLTLEPFAPPASGSEAEAPRATVHLVDILAVSFDAGKLLPLASLAPAEQRPAAGRRWTRPVAAGEPGVLGAADIEIPGPMTVTWTLPAGALRVAGVAALRDDSLEWGDCIVTLSLRSGGDMQEAFRSRLNADTPRAPFNLELPSSRAPSSLVLTIDPGDYGPIQDRVVLERALILVGGGR